MQSHRGGTSSGNNADVSILPTIPPRETGWEYRRRKRRNIKQQKRHTDFSFNASKQDLGTTSGVSGGKHAEKNDSIILYVRTIG